MQTIQLCLEHRYLELINETFTTTTSFHSKMNAETYSLRCSFNSFAHKNHGTKCHWRINEPQNHTSRMKCADQCNALSLNWNKKPKQTYLVGIPLAILLHFPLPYSFKPRRKAFRSSNVQRPILSAEPLAVSIARARERSWPWHPRFCFRLVVVVLMTASDTVAALRGGAFNDFNAALIGLRPRRLGAVVPKRLWGG